MNPENPRHLKKLRDALLHSRQKLRVFRENRLEAVRQYVGAHYSQDGAGDRVPVNLLELAVQIYVRQLAAKAPRPHVSTHIRSLKPFAATMQLHLDQRVQEIQLGKTMRTAVQDAMFGMGIVKVGLDYIGFDRIGDSRFDDTESFADAIDLDNWVHDISAKQYERVGFAGDRYRLPLEMVRETEAFEKKPREQLQATRKMALDEVGQTDVGQIGTGEETDPDEYQEHVELWDLWLPAENLIVTLPAEGEGEPLRVVEWDGPDIGPYHLLRFSDVPGNIMPLPPVANMLDLHDLENRLFRKLGRQAERQKTILGVQGGADADGRRIVDANDGEAWRLDNPEKAKEYSFGGVDPALLAFVIQVKDLAAYFGGNLDTLGGLSPQTETLGQDQLLEANASKRIADMQDRTVAFAAGVLRALAWYEWTDPVRESLLTKTVPGTDVAVPVKWTPETREGDFLDYHIRVEPYSMQHETPATKLQTIVQVWERFIAPYADAMAQQGIAVNFTRLVRILSEHTNTPEIEEMLTFAQPPEERPVEGSQPKPAQTTRRYERVNRTTGGSRAGRDSAMIQTLLGGGVQPASADALSMKGVG